jgi:hypothetical protein
MKHLNLFHNHLQKNYDHLASLYFIFAQIKAFIRLSIIDFILVSYFYFYLC